MNYFQFLIRYQLLFIFFSACFVVYKYILVTLIIIIFCNILLIYLSMRLKYEHLSSSLLFAVLTDCYSMVLLSAILALVMTTSGVDWSSHGHALSSLFQVVIKIRPVPAVTRYGSLVFPDWESGFWFEREVARKRLQPSSIRLMDNEQVSRYDKVKRRPDY